MNLATIMGYIGKGPELKEFGNDNYAVNFTVATNESFNNQNGERVTQTEWHNVVFYGNTAKVINQYFRKGSRILIEGKIRTRSYEVEGGKRYITEIVGSRFHFVDKASDNQQQNQHQSQQQNQTFPSSNQGMPFPNN